MRSRRRGAFGSGRESVSQSRYIGRFSSDLTHFCEGCNRRTMWYALVYHGVPRMTVGIGCDIGGTFTDLVMVNDETGAIEVEKVLTTPSDPSLGIERGLQTFSDRMENCISQASLL